MARRNKITPEQASAEMEDSPELQAYIKRGEESVNAWLARYALVLIGAGVHQVRVEYSGGGGSGQVDGVTFYGPYKTSVTEGSMLVLPKQGGQPILQKTRHEYEDRDVVEDPWAGSSLAGQFEQFLYDLLDKRGWEVDNEGSQGHLIWDLAEDTLHHHHELNITRTEDMDYDGVADLRLVMDPDDTGA